MRAELEKIVGATAVDERPVRDLWPLAIMDERAGKAPPQILVVRPTGRDQVADVLRWATSNHVAVTPMGAGSGVCGALSPAAGEVVMDMGAFDRVLDIDETNLICRCEAGVNGFALEQQLNARGLTLGHYPSSLPGTTVGGLIATRSSGQESSRYGSIEDMLIGLAVVLPDGTFAAPRPGPRSAAGPALHQLLVGSEGGLGVMIGAVISLVQLLRGASRPHVAFLGRIQGTSRFSDRERHPDNELIPGVLIFRPESGLVYFNVDNVCKTILDRVSAEPALPKLVLLDLSAAPRVDLQSAQALGELAHELTAKHIQVQAVEARSSVRDRLRNEGVDTKLGGINRFRTVADAVEDFQKAAIR